MEGSTLKEPVKTIKNLPGTVESNEEKYDLLVEENKVTREMLTDIVTRINDMDTSVPEIEEVLESLLHKINKTEADCVVLKEVFEHKAALDLKKQLDCVVLKEVFEHKALDLKKQLDIAIDIIDSNRQQILELVGRVRSLEEEVKGLKQGGGHLPSIMNPLMSPSNTFEEKETCQAPGCSSSCGTEETTVGIKDSVKENICSSTHDRNQDDPALEDIENVSCDPSIVSVGSVMSRSKEKKASLKSTLNKQSIKFTLAAGCENWPPSLSSYVSRSFAQCSTATQKNRVKVVLKSKITTAEIMGNLLSTDWALEPLPAVVRHNADEEEIATYKSSLANLKSLREREIMMKKEKDVDMLTKKDQVEKKEEKLKQKKERQIKKEVEEDFFCIRRYLKDPTMSDLGEKPFQYRQEKETCKVFFSVDSPVLIRGVGLFCAPFSGMEAVVNIVTGGKVLKCSSTLLRDVSCYADQGILRLNLQQPVPLTPGQQYSICATIKGGQSLLGQEEKPTVKFSNMKSFGRKVVFNFYPSQGIKGQIPQIYFSFA